MVSFFVCAYVFDSFLSLFNYSSENANANAKYENCPPFSKGNGMSYG